MKSHSKMPIAISVLACTALTALIFALGWDHSDPGEGNHPSVLPPGNAIALIWIFLFGLMAWAYVQVRAVPHPDAARLCKALLLLLLLCFAYPFYTEGLSNPVSGLISNVGIALFDFWLILRLRAICPSAARALAVPLLWLCLATIGLLQEMGVIA